MAANYTNLDPLFKQRYADGFEDLTFKDRPAYALMPKKTDIAGASTANRAYHAPIKYANTSAVSGNFAYAQGRAAATVSAVQAWEVYTMHQYGFINLDNESLMRSEGKENAFVDEKALEMDAIVEKMANRLHHYMYGDGTGSLANVGNAAQMPSFATSTMVLSNPETCVYYSPGDELTASSAETSGARAFGTNGHGWYIIAINLDAGTFQAGNAAGAAVNLNDAADGIPAVANGDWIQFRGDMQAAGTLGGTVLTGMPGFIPSVANVSQLTTPLYGVTRSVFADFLGGSRFDASNYGIEEGLIRAANTVAKKGGRIKTFFIDHKKFTDLVAAIAARGQVQFLEVASGDKPEIGFSGVTILSAKGPVDVVPDYGCPSTLAMGVDLDNWEFISVGETVSIMNGDGLDFLRINGSDGMQAYWYSYSNLVPRSPRDNVNVTLAA